MCLHAEASFSSQNPGGGRCHWQQRDPFKSSPGRSPPSCCFTSWAVKCAQAVIWVHEAHAVSLTSLSWHMEAGVGGPLCWLLPACHSSIIDLGLRESGAGPGHPLLSAWFQLRNGTFLACFLTCKVEVLLKVASKGLSISEIPWFYEILSFKNRMWQVAEKTWDLESGDSHFVYFRATF